MRPRRNYGVVVCTCDLVTLWRPRCAQNPMCLPSCPTSSWSCTQHVPATRAHTTPHRRTHTECQYKRTHQMPRSSTCYAHARGSVQPSSCCAGAASSVAHPRGMPAVSSMAHTASQRELTGTQYLSVVGRAGSVDPQPDARVCASACVARWILEPRHVEHEHRVRPAVVASDRAEVAGSSLA